MAGKCRNRLSIAFDISLSFMFLCNIFVIINLKPFFMHFRGDILVTKILNLCHIIFFIRYLDVSNSYLFKTTNASSKFLPLMLAGAKNFRST